MPDHSLKKTFLAYTFLGNGSAYQKTKMIHQLILDNLLIKKISNLICTVDKNNKASISNISHLSDMLQSLIMSRFQHF